MTDKCTSSPSERLGNSPSVREHGSRREQIRLAAVEAIAQSGFHETTIQDIAAEAGVAVGTIYNYFRSKEEILGYIFAVECQRRTQVLQDLLEQDRPVAERFADFLRMHFADLRRNPALGKLLIQEHHFPIRPELEPIRQYASQLPALLARLLQPSDRSGLKGDMAFGALQAVTVRYLQRGDMDTETAVTLFGKLFTPDE